MWTFFHVPVCHPYMFFGEMSVQVFCMFFSWVTCVCFLFCFVLFCFLLLSFKCRLYILEIKPLLVLSVASFETIFSHSIGCLSFMVSFAVQKLLSLSPIGVFLVLFLLA